MLKELKHNFDQPGKSNCSCLITFPTTCRIRYTWFYALVIKFAISKIIPSSCFTINLGGGGGGSNFSPTLLWLSLNNCKGCNPGILEHSVTFN